MILKGFAEFRKIEVRRSKNGNSYQLLKFEDPVHGDQLSLYSPLDASYKIDKGNLQKGKYYNLEFNYNYNSYDHAWRVDLEDITGETSQKDLEKNE